MLFPVAHAGGIISPAGVTFIISLCAAHLHEQLGILQGQYEKEQRSSRREVLKLQDRLQQACDERKEAQQEMLRLREALQDTIHAKVKYIHKLIFRVGIRLNFVWYFTIYRGGTR